MQVLPWASIAGPTAAVLVPLHGDPAAPESTNDFVLWALPLTKLVFNLSGAAVLGTLLLACTALRPATREFTRALNFAGVSAVVWTVASVVAAFVDYLENSGESIAFTEAFGNRLALFFTSVGLGQTWLATVVIAAAIPLLCLGARQLSVAAAAAVLALAGWVPLALNGHPNYGEGHEAGILAYALHIIAAASWLGGLLALVVLRPVLSRERLRAVAARYSTLALIAFVLLVFSGFLRARATVGAVGDLLTPFGLLVLVKIVVALLLGALGWVHRRWVLDRLAGQAPGRTRWFWWLMAAELILMGVASAAAVTLLRRDEPVPGDPVVNYRLLAEKMADEPLPPAPGVWTLLTQTAFDPLWFAVVVAGAVCYAAGVRRLRHRGTAWSPGRTLSWFTGLAVLLWATNGGVNQYQNFLLSAQVLFQMGLTAIAGPLLVLGRPVTLAREAVRARGDGSRGVREWIDAAAVSRTARALAHPWVAAGLLAGSVLAFYVTPLLGWSARSLLGHQWTVLHFVAVGCVFGTSVLRSVGKTTQPPRGPWGPLSAVSAFYAVLGTTMILGAQPLSADWYAAMREPWGVGAPADQRIGGWYLIVLGCAQAGALATVSVRRRHGRGRNVDVAACTVPPAAGGPGPDHLLPRSAARRKVNMSTTASSAPAPSRAPAQDPGKAELPPLGPVGTLRWAWTQLTKMNTALFLLLLLAVAAVPGSVFPQRVQDPSAVADYLEANPVLGEWLDRLQFFDVFSSVWFSAIYLLLFVSLVGCVLPRAGKHWRAWRAQPPRTPRRLDRLPEHRSLVLDGHGNASPPAPDDAVAEAAQLLRKRGYRAVVRDTGSAAPSVAAERGMWKEVGNVVFHLALLGVLISVAVGSLFGFKGQKILVEGDAFANSLINYDSFTPGTNFDTERLEPFSITLEDLEVEFYRDTTEPSQYGTPIDFTAEVTVQEPGADPRQEILEVNDPVNVDGVKAFLIGNGYAPVVRVTDGNGDVAFKGPVVAIPSDGVYTSSVVIKAPDAAPDQLSFTGLLLPTAVTGQDGIPRSVDPGLGNPVLILSSYYGDIGLDSGVPQNVYALDVEGLTELNGMLAPHGPITLSAADRSYELPAGKGRIEFLDVKRYAALDIVYDPGRAGAFVSFVAAFTGLLMSMFVSRRRVWVRATRTTDTDGVPGTVLEYGLLARGEDPRLGPEAQRLEQLFTEQWPTARPPAGAATHQHTNRTPAGSPGGEKDITHDH